MKKYICIPCNYIYDEKEYNNISFENQPSDWKCPVCGVGKDLFKEINEETQEDNNPETQKKHIPLIIKSKNNKLIIKIGEINHPMTKAHYIAKVQIFSENNLLKSINLKPSSSNTVETELEYKENLTVLAYCNIHGIWKNN